VFSNLKSTEEDNSLWLKQVREFVDDAVQQIDRYKDRLQGKILELDACEQLEESTVSAWVDGGSIHFNLVGGSLYIVRAAGALFRKEKSPIWFENMKVGFTTLPRDVDRFVGIQRNILELECILELLSNKPEFAILDNGLASYATMGVPYSVLRFFSGSDTDDSPECEYFHAFLKFMKRFDLLIQECQLQDILLIGAAKDPRSRVFVRDQNLGSTLIDSSTIGMLAGNLTGFTKPIDAPYLEVERVKHYLESISVLVDGRSEFMTTYGILKPRARVFRLDFLKNQSTKVDRIKRFATTMHDNNGYLMPSHIVHNKATIHLELAEALSALVVSEVAKKDFDAARFVFGTQRRSRFG
jgi:hypothetical protein